MESQSQNPELRHYPENFHPCFFHYSFHAAIDLCILMFNILRYERCSGISTCISI